MGALAGKLGQLPRPLVVLVSLVLAALLNIALIQSILFLNRAAAARAPEIARQQRLQTLELPPVNPVDPIEEVEPVEQVETLMEVSLDAPALELEQLELPELSLDLDLSLAPLGGTSVQVQSRVDVHAPSAGDAGQATPQAGTPLNSESVDQPPQELSTSPKPRYPRAAQRRRLQGVVTIELLIDQTGRVEEYRNPKGEPLLVRAVIDTLPRLRYSPAQHRGETVSVWGHKTFSFKLPGGR